jgi:hypothetical protein
VPEPNSDTPDFVAWWEWKQSIASLAKLTSCHLWRKAGRIITLRQLGNLEAAKSKELQFGPDGSEGGCSHSGRDIAERDAHTQDNGNLAIVRAQVTGGCRAMILQPLRRSAVNTFSISI